MRNSKLDAHVRIQSGAQRDRLIKPLMFVNSGKKEGRLSWRTDNDYQEPGPRKYAEIQATWEVRCGLG